MTLAIDFTERRHEKDEVALRERPTDVLPDPGDLLSTTVYDVETSGLYVDAGHRVCAVAVAYRTDEEYIRYHSFPFDQGRAEDKGLRVQYMPDTPVNRKRGLVGLPAGDPHGRWDWDTDYNLPESEWRALCQWLLDAGRVTGLSNHNIKFDTLHMLAGTRHWRGVDLEKYIRGDTMLANPLIWPRLNTNALKPTGAALWGEDEVSEAAIVAEALLEARKRYGLDGKRYDLIPWGVNGPYVAQDTVLAYRLIETQQAMVNAGVVSGGKINRAVDVCRVLTRMERRGFGPYDVERSREIADRIDARIAELKKRLPFAPASGSRAAVYFFEELGVAPWKVSETPRKVEVVDDTRKSAKPGTKRLKLVSQGDLGASVARRMADAGVPHAAEWADITELTIANQMFYRNYEQLAGVDRRLRTNFRQAHVRSGRLSVERFQAQALPKKLGLEFVGELLPEPRSLFGVAPGRVRKNLDLGQAELRIASHLCGCKTMSQALVTGEDFHGQTTKRVFHIAEDDPEWGLKRDIGKRLPVSVDTPVPTPEGWTTAGELKVGDYILGRDGQPTGVNGVFPQGVIPVYDVTLADGRVVRAGAHHLWHVTHSQHTHEKRRDSERRDETGRASRTMTTEELARELDDSARRERRVGYVTIPLPDAAQHTEKHLPVDPYLLGAWLGDGSRCRAGRGVQLATHVDDLPHWREQFGEPRRYVRHAGNSRSAVWYWEHVGNYDLQAAARDLAAYTTGSVKQRLALLQGLMDTDGTARAGRRATGTPKFYNTDYDKAALVVTLVRSLGGYATVREYHSPSRGDSRRPIYHVTVQLRGHNPFRMERKASLWRPARKQVVRIVGVSPAGEVAAVCWTVAAPDSLFLAGDYVVTHNTFASIFQVGAPKFRDTLWDQAAIEWSLQECKNAVYAWRNAYPEFGRAYYEWMEYAERHKYVPLVDGQPSWMAGPRDYPNTAWNRVVQGSLAIFSYDWLVAVERATAKYDALVLTVHDSVVLDLPEEVADDVCAELKEMTESMWFDTFGIPGKVDIGPWQK